MTVFASLAALFYAFLAPAAMAAPGVAATPAPTVSNAERSTYTGQGCSVLQICLYERGYEFDLNGYTGTHYLSYFTGEGHYTNNAVGLCSNVSCGGQAYLKIYNINGTRIKCVPPNGTFTLYNWEPAWRVDVTTSGC